MTEYNGQAITYDRIGNPLTYRDGMTMTWRRGRQLTTLQTEENSIQYKYDSDSIRASKIVNGVVHTYEYLGGLLMHETRGTQAYDYYYDANGQLYAVSYKLSENDTKKVYYFTHNWRGDIVGIYNGNGDLKATYEYDAWGNVTAIEDANGNAITSATHIANLNPFRYRGYYQDTETGLYYLMSRYYDPVTHRFVNADGYFQSGGDILDTNMNAYCRNNPIIYVDYFGTRCHANDNGRSGPLCFTNFETGYCNTCKAQECCMASYETTLPVQNYELISGTKKNNGSISRKDARKGSENRQPAGSRERNVKHPNGEEHSRVPKGNGIKKVDYDFYAKVMAVEGIVVSVIGITYLVANDITGVGVADDAAIVPATMIIWECAAVLGG